MRDTMYIGSVPFGEDCAQVGTENYHRESQIECHEFREQLRRMFGSEPDGASLSIKSNPHDFGTYYEVVCYYDDSKPLAVEYACKCESEGPENWDGLAKASLTSRGYSFPKIG